MRPGGFLHFWLLNWRTGIAGGKGGGGRQHAITKSLNVCCRLSCFGCPLLSGCCLLLSGCRLCDRITTLCFANHFRPILLHRCESFRLCDLAALDLFSDD